MSMKRNIILLYICDKHTPGFYVYLHSVAD